MGQGLMPRALGAFPQEGGTRPRPWRGHSWIRPGVPLAPDRLHPGPASGLRRFMSGV